MRILLTTDTVGGVWQFTAVLAKCLLAEHDVCLVSFGRQPSADQTATVHALQSTYGAHALRFHGSDLPLEWMTENASAFAAGAELLDAIADDFRPDVFHSSQFCWGALRTRPGHALADTPTLVTAHSDVLSWAAACRPGGLEHSDWLMRYVELVQRGLDGADLIAAPTRSMLDELGRNFRMCAEGTVVPNGSSAASSTPSRVRKIQAITAGRHWDEGKNLAILTDIEPPMPILVAGESSFDGANSAASASLTPLGPLPHGELLAMFAESALYLCTSRYEPFGLAPLEAARCGCALLLNDLPSLREIWDDAAMYFTDARTLQAGLETLAAGPELLRGYAALAVSRAASFSAERMTTTYLNLYRQMVRRAVPEALACAS